MRGDSRIFGGSFSHGFLAAPYMTCCDFGVQARGPDFGSSQMQNALRWADPGNARLALPVTRQPQRLPTESRRTYRGGCCQSARAGSLAHAWHVAGCDCWQRHDTGVQPEIRWSGKPMRCPLLRRGSGSWRREAEPPWSSISTSRPATACSQDDSACSCRAASA